MTNTRTPVNPQIGLKREEALEGDTIVQCPECAAAILVPAGTFKNEIFICPGCTLEWETTSIAPLILEEAPPVEEDWGE